MVKFIIVYGFSNYKVIIYHNNQIRQVSDIFNTSKESLYFINSFNIPREECEIIRVNSENFEDYCIANNLAYTD